MRGGRRGHVGSHLCCPENSLDAGFSNLRHVEMGKISGSQDCHSTVVKCIICFLAFNNLVTWNFTIFFNSQVVEEAKTPQVEKEDSTRKTPVSPNLSVNSGNSSSRLPSERLERTGSVNRSSLGSFFTSYMVTTLLFPTVVVFSLNAIFGHLQSTAPRLFASRAIAILLCVVQLVLTKVKSNCKRMVLLLHHSEAYIYFGRYFTDDFI